jgi:hypothetical protein
MPKPRGYWTKEKCHTEALKYKTRKEFVENAKSAYTSAYKNDWIKDICSHMEYHGTRFIRCVYVYEFVDNYVYVGLTYNTKRRDKEHKNGLKSAVYKHIKETGLIPNFIPGDYIPVEEAQKLEGETVQKYKLNGWCILNKAKTGNLGGSVLIWNKEKCAQEALKFNSRNIFRINSKSYRAALANGWLNEICQHMTEGNKPITYWTKEKCHEEALKYKHKTVFEKSSTSAYRVSCENGWYKEICSHMEVIIKPDGYWTKEACKEEAVKYKSRTTFFKNSISAYKAAYRSGCLNEICQHMVSNKKPNGYWGKENCAEEALKYKSRSEFYKKSGAAYNSAHKNKWLEEICTHMEYLQKPNGFWNKERCREEALKYKNKNEFIISSKAGYSKASKNGWLDEICSHMISIRKFSGYWTYDKCKEEALKYNTKNDFYINSKGAYLSAYRKGWYEEICSHMVSPLKPNGYWTYQTCKEEALKYKTNVEFRKKMSGAYNVAYKNSWLDEICSHMIPPKNKRKSK